MLEFGEGFENYPAVDEAASGVDRSLFRQPRFVYPGSRFGPKTRYDLPKRLKAYGNADEAELVLFAGTALEPQAWSPLEDSRVPATSSGALSLSARSILRPVVGGILPELPLLDSKNSDIHGVLVLGGKRSGKSSLILSVFAVLSGKYPIALDSQAKKHALPVFGQSYQLPEKQVVRLAEGRDEPQWIQLTEGQPCGTDPKEEQPLCATVSPNSSQHWNAVPSWLRVCLRSGNIPNYAVLLVIDATAKPLWEDTPRCRDMARLLAVLKRSMYNVIIAVTKVRQARAAAMKDVAYTGKLSTEVGKDPRSNYESYADRYLGKVCAALQARAGESDWSLSPPGTPTFPLPNVTIFDVPTWTGALDHQTWLGRRGTPDLPNLRYMNSQLTRLLQALCYRCPH